jgi:hypothetical protein
MLREDASLGREVEERERGKGKRKLKRKINKVGEKREKRPSKHKVNK